jgi:TolB protein
MTLHVSDQNSDIFQFKMDGRIGDKNTPTLRKIRQLTHNSSIETEPSISPDNSMMAYVSDQTSEPQIYLMNLRTKKYNRITRKGGYNVSPAFSPNGKYLAYRSIREGKSAIYRYELASKKEIKLTPDSIIAEEPTWSPDDSLIVFAGRLSRRSPTKVYYMLASGGDYYRMTKTKQEVAESNPVWGPALR